MNALDILCFLHEKLLSAIAFVSMYVATVLCEVVVYSGICSEVLIQL